MTGRINQHKHPKKPYQKPRIQFFGFVRQLTQSGSITHQEQSGNCNPQANSFGTGCNTP